MSVQTEINRIKLNINNALDLVASYGVQIEATDASNELPTRIALIAEALEGFIKYTQLTLTEALKALARTNIGAASKSDIPIIPTNISAFNNDAGYLTLHLDISGKLDVILDLTTIRKGASLGATALLTELYTGTYSKPNGGIPKTDLESTVLASLGKADTALLSYTETDPTVPLYIKDNTTVSLLSSSIGTSMQTKGIAPYVMVYKGNFGNSFDDAKEQGTYRVVGSIIGKNGPEGLTEYYGALLVISVGSGDLVVQRLSNGITSYTRSYMSNSWSAWKLEGFNTADINELSSTIGTNLYGATTASELASVVVDNISDISLATLRDKLKAIW